MFFAYRYFGLVRVFVESSSRGNTFCSGLLWFHIFHRWLPELLLTCRFVSVMWHGCPYFHWYNYARIIVDIQCQLVCFFSSLYICIFRLSVVFLSFVTLFLKLSHAGWLRLFQNSVAFLFLGNEWGYRLFESMSMDWQSLRFLRCWDVIRSEIDPQNSNV